MTMKLLVCFLIIFAHIDNNSKASLDSLAPANLNVLLEDTTRNSGNGFMIFFQIPFKESKLPNAIMDFEYMIRQFYKYKINPTSMFAISIIISRIIHMPSFIVIG